MFLTTRKGCTKFKDQADEDKSTVFPHKELMMHKHKENEFALFPGIFA